MYGNAANVSAAMQLLAGAYNGDADAMAKLGLTAAQTRDFLRPLWISSDLTFQQGMPWEMFTTTNRCGYCRTWGCRRAGRMWWSLRSPRCAALALLHRHTAVVSCLLQSAPAAVVAHVVMAVVLCRGCVVDAVVVAQW